MVSVQLRNSGQGLWYALTLPKSTAMAPVALDVPLTSLTEVVNPLTGDGLAGLFRTHPSTADRVARLHAMANGQLPY